VQRLIIIILIIMIIIIIVSVQSLVGRKTTHVLRENAEGGYIGDAEHCKNFQSSNMMMLISRLID